MPRSEKRETDLISLSIINSTREVFPEEERLILASTNLMRRMTSISKDAISEITTKPHLSAVMNLFARNRELVHFAAVCLMGGGYASTKVLARAALENALYMQFFNEKPEVAKEWFSDPEKFWKKWKPEEIRRELFENGSTLLDSYSRFYWRLCEYAHPSSKGWGELIHERGILWHPVFSKDYADECIGLVFFIIAKTLPPFSLAFTRWLPRSLTEELRSMEMKVSQMVSRHFQVKLASEPEKRKGE